MNKTHDCSKNAIITEDALNAAHEENVTDGLADSFKVLGDRTRMKILFCLLTGEKNVCTIASLTSGSHSNTSHQLKVLKDNRIVDYKKQGKEVFYFLADHHIRELIEISVEHFNNCH